MKFVRIALLITIFLSLLPSVSAQENGVSEEHFSRLSRGVNLPYWFWYGPQYPVLIELYFTEADFALMRHLGFTFVRIPISLDFLLDEGSPDYLNQDNLRLLDAEMQEILAHGLAVVVDLHSTTLDEVNYPNIFSGRLETEDWFFHIYEQFWRSFAKHLSSYDPEMVFIEPMNEPVFESNPDAWPPMQERLITTIRENAPDHTIIATGALWSSIDTLIRLEPLDDPNIVYNFHYYEPFWFTHQGAAWGGQEVAGLHSIPYPSSPEAVEAILPELDQSVQALIRLYGQERWNIDRIDSRIAQAAAWAERHNVRLVSTEFGAYKLNTPPEDRIQWLFDVRTTLEKYGIGWAMWDYHDTFGLVERNNDEIRVDWEVVEALGLNSQ